MLKACIHAGGIIGQAGSLAGPREAETDRAADSAGAAAAAGPAERGGHPGQERAGDGDLPGHPQRRDDHPLLHLHRARPRPRRRPGRCRRRRRHQGGCRRRCGVRCSSCRAAAAGGGGEGGEGGGRRLGLTRGPGVAAAPRDSLHELSRSQRDRGRTSHHCQRT